MLIKNFGYFTKEAWVSLKRGGIMTLVAASTIAVSLFVLGVFLLLFLNLYNLLQTLNSKLDVVAYISPQVQKNDLDLLNMTVAQIPGVKKIQFVSKEKAWQEFKETYNNLNLDTFMDENPLPDSFKVEVRDLSYINIVAGKLQGLKGIDEVRYGGDLAERVAGFIKIISSAGFVIVVLLVMSTWMIVVNTIRLTVLARENEINIMSLVGAAKGFIRYPFIFEGMYLGLLGSSIALVGLKLGYDVVAFNIEKNVPFFPVNLQSTEVNFVFLIVLAVGFFLGTVGGYFSVSKTLKPE